MSGEASGGGTPGSQESSSASEEGAGSRGQRPSQISLAEFQALIKKMYFEKDKARGIEGTFLWLMEEVGELATALRSGTHEERALEFADVLAWLVTIANVAEVDLTDAVARKYGAGCPGCGRYVCVCDNAEKP